ncbi:hypothetical protein [Clostridium sp.]|uniref:hypothetical protein n=1 Tax=Clostridium sp. TaxID=1506 RepID=UPI002620F556|nr:hypothetical protein [Clostridium sp.]
MKKLQLIVLIILCIFLCSCGFKAPVNAPVKENEAKSIDYSSLSNDLFSYDILLDGKKYTLPVNFSELEADGWTIDPESAKHGLMAHFYVINIKITKNQEEVTVNFVNNSSESRDLNKCDVGLIRTYGGFGAGKVSVVLPKGISFNATEDEITSAYGKPSKIESLDDNFDTYTYIDPNVIDETYQNIELIMSKKDHMLSSIQAENMYSKEKLNQSNK